MNATTTAVETIFARCGAEHRAAFIAFLTAGFPSLEQTAELIMAASDGGADIIELGFPYSDPLADGPTIQTASQQALDNGATFDRVLDLTAQLRVAAPLLAFSYYNPLFSRGLARSVNDLAGAGFAGIVVPDLAFEEADELRALCAARGLATIFLVAPTTPLERAARIAAASTGFVYVVSRTGVTGASVHDTSRVRAQIAQLRSVTDKPLAVGFGMSTATQVTEMATVADGVIVGSALLAAASEQESLAAFKRRCAQLACACRGA